MSANRCATVGSIKDRERWSGMSPADEAEFVAQITRHGNATTDNGYRPTNHFIVGVGVGHDDARFAETGSSMAAYYENGDAFGGRWWEGASFGRYYGASR